MYTYLPKPRAMQETTSTGWTPLIGIPKTQTVLGQKHPSAPETRQNGLDAVAPQQLHSEQLHDFAHIPILRRRARQSGIEVAARIQAPPIVHRVLSSPGRPLDSATREFMEPRLRHNFGHVRVHTGSAAEESAHRIHALAYTVGHNIVFGTNQHQPNTANGRRLLAHELTHVLQQTPSTGSHTQLPARFPRARFTPSHDGRIPSGYLQRQAAPQSPAQRARARRQSRMESDAFELCVAADALGFIPTVTWPVVRRTARAMQAAIVHHVENMRQFEAVVQRYSTDLLLANPQSRQRWRNHHRRNLVNYSISGQTVHDSAFGDAHIIMVGVHSLRSTREFAERHERAHVGLKSLGVPTAQHHPIMGPLGLLTDRIPHFGIRTGI